MVIFICLLIDGFVCQGDIYLQFIVAPKPGGRQTVRDFEQKMTRGIFI